MLVISSSLDNSGCTATCYRDFIFLTGAKNVSYSCEDGILTPQLLSCMRKVFNISVNDSYLFQNLTSRCVFFFGFNRSLTCKSQMN